MSQTHGRPGRGSTPSTPRWVKVFGIIVIVLVLLFGILHLTGNSLGGPGSHSPPGGAVDTPSSDPGDTPSGNPGGHTPPSSVTEHGVQQP